MKNKKEKYLITIEVEKHEIQFISEKFNVISKKLIDDMITKEVGYNVFKKLVAVSSEVYGITQNDLIKGTRKREVIDISKIISKLLRDEIGLSFDKIGQLLNRSHCTVIYQVNQCEEHLYIDKIFTEKYNTLKAVI